MLQHEKLMRTLIREREAQRSHHVTVRAALRRARAATPSPSPRGGRWSWPALADRVRASAGRRAQARTRRRALRSAFAAFAAEQPTWAESAFDLRLLDGPGAEALANFDVEALALAWARQFRYVDERRRERDLRQLRPVAETLLARFREALERRGVAELPATVLPVSTPLAPAPTATAPQAPAHTAAAHTAPAHSALAHATAARTPRSARGRRRYTSAPAPLWSTLRPAVAGTEPCCAEGAGAAGAGGAADGQHCPCC
jgi:hypothetical protein